MPLDNNEDRVVYDISKLPDNYEAYLYLYTVTFDGHEKKYGGYHKGKWDGTYNHSSENEEFIQHLAEAEKVKFEILEAGYDYDMKTREHDFLHENNAKNSEDFYNNNNGGGKGVNTNRHWRRLLKKIRRCKSLQSKIRKVPVSELKKYKKYQVRSSDDSDAMEDIANRLKLEQGNTDHLMVHVLEDFYGTGEHLIINGNHTILGVIYADYKHDVELKTMFIPKSEWKVLVGKKQGVITKAVRMLANALNPNEKHRSLGTRTTEVVKEIYESKINDGIEFDSPRHMEDFMGDPWFFTPEQVEKCQEDAAKQYNRHDYKLTGMKYKSEKTLQKEVKNLAAGYNKQKNTIAVSFSSGKLDIGKIVHKTYEVKDKLENPKQLVLCIYHPIPGIKDPVAAWQTKVKKPQNDKLLYKLIQEDWGITVKYHFIEALESDVTETS